MSSISYTGKFIYGVMSNDATLTALVPAAKIQPSAIYNQKPEEGIYYEILNIQKDNVKGVQRAPISTAVVNIECFNAEYNIVQDIAHRIQVLFDKKTPATYYGVSLNGCIVTNYRTDYDSINNLHYVSLVIDVRLNT
jgi:hypothetical protein